MMRLIFFAVVLCLAAVAGMALALEHYFGWKGLIALPLILVALVWLGKKGIGYLFRRFALGLFSLKSRVLRGAEMTVHSIIPVPKPIFPEEQIEEEPAQGDEKPAHAALVEANKEPEEPKAEAPEDPKEYVAVDMTITPKSPNADSVWEPGEFILTSDRLASLMDLEDGTKEVGTTELVEIWDGSGFVGDDPGKYPGTQRLKVTFAVRPGTGKAWLHYYAETIGQLELPRPELRVG
jgi:hypothetical protein